MTRQASRMRPPRLLPALGAALALLCLAPVAGAQTQTPPRDTGSMAYPEPAPRSGTTRQGVAIPESGSMRPQNFPTSTGTAEPGRTGRDTGSMQYPAAK